MQQLDGFIVIFLGEGKGAVGDQPGMRRKVFRLAIGPNRVVIGGLHTRPAVYVEDSID